MKLTYKYKPITRYATNLLIGVLCAYSVCACDDVKKITPVNTNPDNDQANTQYDPDPTDTGSDKPGNQEKPGEQNNQNDQDKPVEQPDENHQETPNDQDIPVEQPDEDIPENPNDQDIPVEQPDQDHQENQNDQDTPVEQPDQDIPGSQDDQGKCDPGYVWVDYSLDHWVQKSYPDKDYNNKCVACAELTTIVDKLRNMNIYCPGGDDLKGKEILYDQMALCPEYTEPNNNLSDCYCPYGVPPPPKEDCHPSSTRKKPLIISPKVNVVRRNNSTTQLLLRHKMRERKTNKR